MDSFTGLVGARIAPAFIRLARSFGVRANAEVIRVWLTKAQKAKQRLTCQLKCGHFPAFRSLFDFWYRVIAKG